MKKPAIVRAYQALAYTTGVGLIILVFIGVPVQVWGHNKSIEMVVGTAHGFLYMAYVVVALALSLQARFNPIKAVLVAAAGTIPFCAFIAEHYIAREASEIINARKAKTRPAPARESVGA